MRAAIVADDFLDLAEFVGGHGGKQVVLDLAGETAGAEINSRMIFNVAAGEDLFAEEIDCSAALLQGHALMIGREDQGEIEAQEGLMRDGEENGVRETEKISQQAEIPDRVKN